MRHRSLQKQKSLELECGQLIGPIYPDVNHKTTAGSTNRLCPTTNPGIFERGSRVDFPSSLEIVALWASGTDIPPEPSGVSQLPSLAESTFREQC